MAGTMETRMREKLTRVFEPVRLELVNESHMHAVPKGSETHFRLLLVAEKFQGLSRVARGRLVHEALSEELRQGVHALSHRTMTPEEWRAAGESVEMVSPDCLGGSKRDT